MRVTSEFIKFDDDDQGNTDGTGGAYPYGPSEDPFNLKIYYCYYEPGNPNCCNIRSQSQLNLLAKTLNKEKIILKKNSYSAKYEVL